MRMLMILLHFAFFDDTQYIYIPYDKQIMTQGHSKFELLLHRRCPCKTEIINLIYLSTDCARGSPYATLASLPILPIPTCSRGETSMLFSTKNSLFLLMNRPLNKGTRHVIAFVLRWTLSTFLLCFIILMHEGIAEAESKSDRFRGTHLEKEKRI